LRSELAIINQQTAFRVMRAAAHPNNTIVSEKNKCRAQKTAAADDVKEVFHGFP
jgi:hypothetical protein